MGPLIGTEVGRLAKNGETGADAGASNSGHEFTEDGWLLKVGNRAVEKLSANKRLKVKHMNPNKFLLHTMDGHAGRGNWESGQRTLTKKRSWPHFVVAYDENMKIRIGQYYSIYQNSYALKGHNVDDVVQVEIGANSRKAFTKQFPELAAAVHDLFVALNLATKGNIPLCMDKSIYFYDAAHMSLKIPNSDFKKFRGLLGHQHVPTLPHADKPEDHGDPGAICAELIISGKPCKTKNLAETVCPAHSS